MKHQITKLEMENDKNLENIMQAKKKHLGKGEQTIS